MTRVKCRYCNKFYQSTNDRNRCVDCEREFKRLMNETMNKITECVVTLGGKVVTGDK